MSAAGLPVVDPAAAPTPATAPRPALAARVLVLGGSGYAAGELLRLLACHPRLAVAGVVSDSQAGLPLGEAFPHLAAAYPGVRFLAIDEAPRLFDGGAAAGAAAAGAGAEAPLAVLCGAPHGAAAPWIDRLLGDAERARVRLPVVDLSADFRFADAADYERVYGRPHGAPARLAQFRCAVPEHAALAFAPAAAEALAPPHIGHPGCFPTSVLLAAVPLVRGGWIEPEVHVVAVTGSTGAGRTPSATTHHPARRSNLFAYNPLAHRHEPEMRALAAAAAGQPVAIHFVPQAGPFARGIYATLQARLARPATGGAAADADLAAEIAADLAAFYAHSPFVDVLAAPPRLQDVVGTNRCRLSVAVAGDRLVAFSAIDNLTKGAAGGAIQWLNRMLGLPEAAGLDQPGIGWL